MVYNQANKNHPKAENVSESVQSKINRLFVKTFCAYLKFSTDCSQPSWMLLFQFQWNDQTNRGSMVIHSYSFNLVLDIDECSSNSHSCDANAVCNNTRGSYICACKLGYSGDGKYCTGKLLSLNKKYKITTTQQNEFLQSIKFIIKHNKINVNEHWVL